MTSRRHYLTLIGASIAGLAGCGGNTSSSTPTQTNSENSPTPTPEQTIEETPAGESNPTETVEEDLTGEELYFNWVHGGIYEDEEHEEIMESVQGTGPNSISFQQINNALEETEGTRVQQVANAVENAANQYTQADPENNYENRHRHIMSAVHQTLQQRNENFEVYSMTDAGVSNEFVDESLGLEYSKIWVENEEGGYEDINLSLDPDYVATHIEGTEANGEVEDSLQDQREVERYGDLPAHDLEALQEGIESANEEDERDSIYEDYLEVFENYMFSVEDGYAAPSTEDDWEAFHEGIEEGPDVVLNLNEAYHNSEYAEDGEVAGFTVEEDGSVTMQDASEGEISQLAG